MSTALISSDLFEQFLQRAKAKAQDGLTLADCGEIWTEAVDLLVAEATHFVKVVGSEKKEWVLEQLGELFDTLAPSIPLPWFLQVVRPLFLSAIRGIVLLIASGVIETTYSRIKPATS